MIRLAALLAALETAADPVPPLVRYLRAAPPPDAAAAIALLLGTRPRRTLTPAALRAAACRQAGIPDWLFDDSAAVAGSVAEAIANLLPWPDPQGELPLAGLADRLAGADADGVLALLAPLPPPARLVLIRLATGTFRTTLPAPVIARALADAFGADPAAIQLRLAGWRLSDGIAPLTSAQSTPHGPRAFAALRPFAGPTGAAAGWLAIRPPGGPRLHLIRRDGQGQIWAEDGHLLTDTRPDLHPLLHRLPDATVLELAGPPGAVQALDLLDGQGADAPYARRHDRLSQICAGLLAPVPRIAAPDWPALDHHRTASGLWLRPGTAAPADPWHHWPAPLRRIDAVLVHAELSPGGQGIAALTFALRAGNALVPVARTTDGLPPEDLADLARWIRAHATARFGPVRELPPVRLFRLAYQSAEPAPRRKAGLWLADARILHPLPDHRPDQIATLDSLRGPGA